jgi:Domain of unknown function (DUF4279)
MTKSEHITRKTYASFRVKGDSLDPQQVTRILRAVPTIAYRKGEKYFAGERSGYLTGQTGLWLLSTNGIVASDNLHHHLLYIVGILVPDRHDIEPLTGLRALLAHQKTITADLACFWHGRFGEKKPSIPKMVTEVMKLLPADLEADFGTDSRESERQSA